MSVQRLKDRWFGGAEEEDIEEAELASSEAVLRGKAIHFLSCEYLPIFREWILSQRDAADGESFIHEDLLIQKGARIAYKAVLGHLDNLAEKCREE